MSRFICCVGFSLLVSVAFAQKVYFVYLESESQQPFFAKIRDKTYNSSPSGYLILSNLRDSSYAITIGFPGDKWPEQQFSIPIRTKDRGFQLKNLGEKGWGLFDLQTLSILMPEGAPKGKAGSIRPGGVSAFTALLSKAANDPSLLESPMLAKNDNKPVIVQQASKKEDAVAKTEQPASKKEDAVVKTEQPVAKKEDAIAKTEQPATKKEDTVAKMEQPATKKEDAIAKTEQPATKKEDAIAKTEQPATKKEDAIVKTEQPATKKEDGVAKTEQPLASGVAIGQTKKEAPSIETAKLPDDKKSTAAIDEQQKKPDTGVTENKETANKTVNTDAANKTTGATAATLPQVPNNIAEPSKEVKETKSAEPERYKRSVVSKKSESSTTDGFGLVFIDQLSDGKRDTIDIFIPNPKEELAKSNDPSPSPKKFLDFSNDQKSVAAKPPLNKTCSVVATDKDFLNVRKKMAAQTSDEQMINESKKAFKSKCYSSDQIRNLGSLFLNEAGKYQFYEAAYPFSSDQGNFVALQSDFKDNYFIYRFKKLVN